MTAMPWRRSLIIVLVGIAAAVIALLLDPRALLVAYLVTVVTVISIPVGSLAVLMLTYLVRGHWTEGLHLPLAAAALTTPLAGLLFVPVLVGIPWIYPWAEVPAGAPGSFKVIWLAPWFFAGRTVLYFVVWTAIALWVRRVWTDPRRMVVSASGGLIVYALTASLAGIDWLESLTPEFHSSIYGFLFLTFEVLAGFAFALTIALSGPAAPTYRYGAILLSALLLWAYNHAMQYIIVWSGNIPDEVAWYVRRETGLWGVALWGLVVLQFILPFFAMLSARIRNERRPLLAIAALTLGMRFVEAWVLAAPDTHIAGGVLLLAVAGAALAVGAAWWTGFVLVWQRLEASAHDTRALTYAFDSSGSAVSPASQPP